MMYEGGTCEADRVALGGEGEQVNSWMDGCTGDWVNGLIEFIDEPSVREGRVEAENEMDG